MPLMVDCFKSAPAGGPAASSSAGAHSGGQGSHPGSVPGGAGPVGFANGTAPNGTCQPGKCPPRPPTIEFHGGLHVTAAILPRTREIAGGIRPNFHIDAREWPKSKLIYQRINPIHKVWIIFGGK